MKKLNENLTASIRTKYGLTRKITIKDSIRQGGVLSVVEYANMMDNIAKELQTRNQGQQKLGNNTITGCLLWMDDVTLFHENPLELQEMLNTNLIILLRDTT